MEAAKTDTKACINLHKLSGGYLHLPMKLFVAGSASTDVRRVPSTCWLLEHRPSGKRILFDLGIRKDIQGYPPAVYERLQTVVKVEVPRDVFDSLEELGVDPKTQVDEVIFSHLHYDHVGDPSRFGKRTKFLLGPGANELIEKSKAYPAVPDSHYDSNLLPLERTEFLPSPEASSRWSAFGSFPHTIDYFGDGSLLIVNAPGHCAGHINAVVRTKPNGWVYLAGDCTHDQRIFEKKAETAVYFDDQTGRQKCAHADKQAAEEHLQRVRDLKDHIDVKIYLAHAEYLE